MGRFNGITQFVNNFQSVIKVNIRLLNRHLRILRRLLNVTDYEVSVSCYDNDTMQRYNLQYRNVDEPTDVLAFPLLDISEPGKLPIIKRLDDRLLGDILLGIPYIQTECLAENEKLEQMLPIFVLHGLCHLIGYDHETEEQWRLMYSKEMDILQKFNKETGYYCKPLLGVGHYIDETDHES